MTSVARLRRLTRDEVAWRTLTTARIQRDRVAVKLRAPHWDRHALLHVLAPETRRSVAAAVARGDWPSVQRQLARRIGTRDSRFVLSPSRAPSLRNAISAAFPSATADAKTRADRLIQGRYDVLGYRDLAVAASGSSPDWHYDPVHRRSASRQFWADVDYLNPVIGDHKVIWEINRHQHWLSFGRALWLTGDRRYADATIAQLRDWMAANPPLIGVNWASMLELGFRSISWVWALHFLLGAELGSDEQGDADPWLVDLLIGLDRQLAHVEQNLSHYFSPNTHLTGEALALYVAGQSLPELAQSSRWAEVGRGILLREIERQVGRDGGHVERSLHYHRYTLDFYVLALIVAQRSGDTGAAVVFREAVTRLARFARGLADPQGRLATIGDDDGGMLWPMTGRAVTDIRDSLAVAAAILEDASLAPWGLAEETCWLLGDVPSLRTATAAADLDSHLFADTGYAVIRDDTAGDHLIFDVGTHGYLNGGHAHADALSVTLVLDGRPLLVDPGTATYTMDPRLRDRLRKSVSHNTLTLDDRSPSEPDGPFHWRSRTDATLAAWRSNARMGWAEALHDGYSPLRHRRSVIHAAGSGWVIVDEVIGHGAESAAVAFHLDPAWRLSCANDAHGLIATHDDGTIAWLLHDGGTVDLARGDTDAGLGWIAPCYGQLRPASTARFTHPLAGQRTMLTWIGPDGGGALPALERLPVDHDPHAPAIAMRVRRGERSEVTMLRPGDRANRESRTCDVAAYQTDARLLQYITDGDRLRELTLADVTYAWSTPRHLPGVVSEHPVADLHLALNEHVLALWTSAPAGDLRIIGTAAAGVTRITLNGCECNARPDAALDSVVVTAADWGVCGMEDRTCVA